MFVRAIGVLKAKYAVLFSLLFDYNNTLCYWMDIRSPPSSKRRAIGSPTPDRKSFSLLVEEKKEDKASQFQKLVLDLSENVSRDSLTNLRNWLIHNSGIERVEAQTASALVDVLIRAIGKRESKVKGQLNQDSQLALVVLFEYAQKGTVTTSGLFSIKQEVIGNFNLYFLRAIFVV